MRYIFLLLLGFVAVSCNDEDDCQGDLVCTEEFRTILITVVDTDGEAVTLDSFTVTNLDTDTVLDVEGVQGLDGYPIANDAMFNEIPKDGQRIEFVGLLNGAEVIRETFLVGHDCCHVILLEGNTTIQLSL